MTLRKLIEKLTYLASKHGDCEVQIDTEAATFDCHMVDITDVFHDNGKHTGFDPHVYISLDNDTKIHYTDEQVFKFMEFVEAFTKLEKVHKEIKDEMGLSD